MVLFVNGLPLAVIELKNPADENATIWSAHRQLQTYRADVPSLFAFNAALIVSDELQARIGAPTAGRERFKPWRTITGVKLGDRRSTRDSAPRNRQTPASAPAVAGRRSPSGATSW